MSHSIVKAYFCSILSFFLFHSASFAQDLIIAQNGDEIKCKVIEIAPPSIKYRLKTQPEGPIRNIEIIDVFMIKYADGTKELFKEDKTKKASKKESSDLDREYRPFSIGISPTLAVSNGQVSAGGMFCMGVELKPVPLRFLLDGSALYYQRYGYLTMANFDLQYVFKIAKGKLEVYPELGVGISYYSRIAAQFNVGAGLDYRLSNLFSLFTQTRYYISTTGGSGIFTLNLGVRFNFKT